MIRAGVIVFAGSNGHQDLTEALERAGFKAELLDATSELPPLKDVPLFALPGGFSYGDYWRAGMLASQATAVRSLKERIAHGALCIGICNGFQILVEAGILPGALVCNRPLGFRHGWTTLEVIKTASPWTHAIARETLRLPFAHGEGRYVHADGANTRRVTAFRYRDNPNGSDADVAGILGHAGRVLGIMPHPERACLPLLGSEDGLSLFQSAHTWLQQA